MAVVPRLGLAAAGLVLLLGGCGGAVETTVPPPTAGGLAPTTPDKDVGLVGVAPGFDIRTYRVIAVDRLNVPDELVKDAEDRKLAATLPVVFQNELVRRLRETGLFERVVHLGETRFFTPGRESVVRVEGDITSLDSGSRALRYFLGLGTGRARAQAELRFVDMASGRSLLVIADRRSTPYDFFAGDSEPHLQESFGDMARGVAALVARLARGEPVPAK